MVAPRFTPLKPKVTRSPAGWIVVIPYVVFDGLASGNSHGPFADWETAVATAVAISAAFMRNFGAQHSGAICVRAVN